MPLEPATALIVRFTDFSETSRICTLWTRELGKVRALAKGGRRLKSSFETSLDLLALCGIVLLRKTSGSLDLLTEARALERFPQLRTDLTALYGAYYVAELLGDWTEDYDPHPLLFEEALDTLRTLGQPGVLTGPRLARFELVLLKELGYGPRLETCAVCSGPLSETRLAFSASAGGMVCPTCQEAQRHKRALSPACWQVVRELNDSGVGWRNLHDPVVRGEVRQVLNEYIAYLLGRRPRLQPYLGS